MDALRSRLEEVVYRGYARVRRFELYAWYGRERLTQNVFRHLLETYQQVGGARPKLRVLADEGAYLLIDHTRLQTAEKAFGIEKE